MSKFDYVIFASYGNDSIASIQHISDLGKENVAVLFSDTGWAADWWEERVIAGEKFARDCGFTPFRTKSEGMESLVKRKKGWPMGGGGAFCTAELKIKPALAWLDEYDPDGEIVCIVGIRRQESANRADFPEWTDESERHGGRELWAPLVRYTDTDRNELIHDSGFEVLPHRSKECSPCAHAEGNDFRVLDSNTIIKVKLIEEDMGINSKGNHRVFFRPKRHRGALGIEAVVNQAKTGMNYWALCEQGNGAHPVYRGVVCSLVDDLTIKKGHGKASITIKFKTQSELDDNVNWVKPSKSPKNKIPLQILDETQLDLFGCDSGFCGD